MQASGSGGCLHFPGYEIAVRGRPFRGTFSLAPSGEEHQLRQALGVAGQVSDQALLAWLSP